MWKKSNDGGLDFDVSQEVKKEEQPFNPFATAYTTTFNLDFEDVHLPPENTARQRLKDFRKRKYGL